MSDEVNKMIDTAIAKMADHVRAQTDAQRALHFSQAALNLAHTKSVLCGTKANEIEMANAELAKEAAKVAEAAEAAIEQELAQAAESKRK